MERFINFDIIKSPVNWAIVTLMVVTAAMLIALIIPATSPAPDDNA